MSNIISFETAVKLKEAGFPQPVPQVGQVWYGLIRGYSEINMIVSVKDKDIFIDIHGNHHLQEAFDKFGTYAPTVGDLLKELPDWELSYAPAILCSIVPSINPFVISNYDYDDMEKRSFSGDSAVDACAIAYLKLKTT